MDAGVGYDISLMGLTSQFGGVGGIQDINIEIKAGEQVAVVGASGSGKSTLLRCIAGLQTVERGIVKINNVDATDGKRIVVPPSERRVGMVFQDFALFPHMSAYENVRFAMEATSGVVDRSKIFDLLELVGLGGRVNSKPGELSGGEQQRVALARAVATEPRILLLDEPYSSLDAQLRIQLAEMTRSLSRRLAITSILVSHDGDEALRFADRLVYMQSGKIVQEGKVEDILKQPINAELLSLLLPIYKLYFTHDGGQFLQACFSQPIDLPKQLMDVEKIQLIYRPEDISVRQEKGTGHLVTDIYPIGVGFEVVVAVNDGQKLKAIIQEPTLNVGCEVCLHLDPKRIFLFTS
ncbi:MAG: ABC transporter ATP-binding protein [Alphaproteobacteria bacterium]|nr:ABC transporter ATP-binding protein [Alphaproteobacteria bacterium]